MLSPHERIILPLDVPTLAQAKALVAELAPAVGAFKVGLELFNAIGPAGLAELVSAGVRVFYDAKFHDIPNTVAGAVRTTLAQNPGLWMLNVHASGGSAMIAAAVEAAGASEQRPLVIAVTVLTSLDERQLRDELGVGAAPREQVVRLAVLAQAAGVDGVVASPQEAAAVRGACGPSFVIVTPGVRPADAEVGDQRRVATPTAAIAAGSDYLVIGRPILDAPHRLAAAQRIAAELSA